VTDLDANGFKIRNVKGGGGGSGGTTDYNDLDNKPKINDVEVSGNKSAEDYGLAKKNDVSGISEIAREALNMAVSNNNLINEVRGEVSGNAYNIEFLAYQIDALNSSKRDKADNTAAADEFTEWECFPSEREGEKISIVKVTNEFGDTFYLPKIGESLQDGQSLNDPMTEYTWKAHENWICDFDLTARRKVATKTGEPYVTPTGVKNIAIPKYEFVNAAIAGEVLTVAPYTNAQVASDGTEFTVAVGEGGGKTRDCVLRVECGDTVPTITWGANFHPRTDAETDFKCEAGKRNVYWITEYAEGEFVVASWQETTGGNAS
jgi:hypothetical protein